MSEDVKHYKSDSQKPAMLFMMLDKSKQNEAAGVIVDIVVQKTTAIEDYSNRKGHKPLSLSKLRDHFF